MAFAAFMLIGCGSPEGNGPQNSGTEPSAPETTEPAESPPEATVSEPTEASAGNPELDAMRDGGFVIFVRHPETEAAEDVPGHLENLEDCSLQRNLTDAGREDARSLGEDIERLGVPVGEVRSSPYCRTSEAAELVFGQAEIVPELATPRYLPPDDPEVEERLDFLREVFSTPPAEGTNTWVMTHELNLRLVSGVSVPEGGAVVFEPRGGDGFEVFATLPPEWWGRRSPRRPLPAKTL